MTNPADSIFLQRMEDSNEVALSFNFDRTTSRINTDQVRPDADMVMVLNQEELHYLCNLLASQQLGKLKTHDEWHEIWSKETGAESYDADGFRARGITKQTLFSYGEFERRMNMCTIGPKVTEVDHAK